MTRPTMEGWMVRYGRRKIGRSFFHKRYFVLESLVLAYYKRQPSANEVPLKTLPIDGNCRVEDRGLETHHGHTVDALSVFIRKDRSDRSIDPVGRCEPARVASRLVETRLGRLGLASSLSTRGLSFEVSWTQERGVLLSRNFVSRTFHFGCVHFERNGSASGDISAQGSSSSGSSAVQPLRSSHLQSSLVADDFRSLIVSRKREVAVLEAAFEILETAPRDKWFEDLVRKHKIQLEPLKVLVTQPEERCKDSGQSQAELPKNAGEKRIASLDKLRYANGDLPTSEIRNKMQRVMQNNAAVIRTQETLEEGCKLIDETVDSYKRVKTNDRNLTWNSDLIETIEQENLLINAPELSSSKVDSTMFDKLSLDDFPSPQDTNCERLQKKRRQELMKEQERNSRMESLNFGVAAKNVSNPREESSVDSLRPNASAFLEQTEKKPRRSLADRLYEEQFGRPAPPGLKRTYPKGSFYDRCMKEKEQKERDAAAAARVASSPFPLRSAPSPLPCSTESTSSISSQQDEAGDNLIRNNVISNDTNQERKPGAWKCPECTYFNLATDMYCYRCQAERGENGRGDKRDSGRRPLGKGRGLEEAPSKEH